MTIFLTDGGEFASAVQMNTLWDSFDTTIWTTSAGTGRRGGRAIEVRSKYGQVYGGVKTLSGTPITTYCFGAAIEKVHATYGVSFAFYQGFVDFTTSPLFRVSYSPGPGVLRIYDDTETEVQTYTVDLTDYQFVECLVDSAAGTFKLYVNEELVLDIVGFSASAVDAFGVYAENGSGSPNLLNCYIDDLYVADERLGDIAILWFSPSADLSVAFTPSTGTDNYALVDEVPESDTDYNESAAVGDKDIYSSAISFGSLAGDVLAVSVVGFANVPDGGVGSGIIPKIKISGTEYSASQVEGVTITKTNIKGDFFLNPATGAAFTQAEVEALEGFGWEIGS